MAVVAVKCINTEAHVEEVAVAEDKQ